VESEKGVSDGVSLNANVRVFFWLTSLIMVVGQEFAELSDESSFIGILWIAFCGRLSTSTCGLKSLSGDCPRDVIESEIPV
jgi:hypothetical protein